MIIASSAPYCFYTNLYHLRRKGHGVGEGPDHVGGGSGGLGGGPAHPTLSSKNYIVLFLGKKTACLIYARLGYGVRSTPVMRGVGVCESESARVLWKRRSIQREE